MTPLKILVASFLMQFHNLGREGKMYQFLAQYMPLVD